MKLAGAVSVGTLPTTDNVVTFGSAPTSLVYGRKEMDRIHVIGAYSSAARSEWPPPKAKDDVVDLPQLRRTVYGIQAHNLTRANTSIASMENVKRIRIYGQTQEVKGGTLQNCGMVFEYENGGRRSVGECRVGVDEYYDVENPICVKISNVYRVGPETGDTRSTVDFYNEIPEDMDRFVPYYHMTGTLVIRFRHNRSTFWAELLDGDRILRKADI